MSKPIIAPAQLLSDEGERLCAVAFTLREAMQPGNLSGAAAQRLMRLIETSGFTNELGRDLQTLREIYENSLPSAQVLPFTVPARA